MSLSPSLLRRVPCSVGNVGKNLDECDIFLSIYIRVKIFVDKFIDSSTFVDFFDKNVPTNFCQNFFKFLSKNSFRQKNVFKSKKKKFVYTNFKSVGQKFDSNLKFLF